MTSRQVIGPSASRPSQVVRRARLPRWERWLLVCLVLASGVLVMVTLAGVTRVRADSIACLMEVTVRPGHDFTNPDDALFYGQRLCDRVSHGRSYGDIVDDVQSGFHADDQFQASYLIDKAVSEPCPAHIWQLRNSAAHYRLPAG